MNLPKSYLSRTKIFDAIYSGLCLWLLCFRVATNSMYPWQSESNIHLPGGAISVAHQFLRCVLHQLAPNGIFTQMFQTNAPEKVRIQFFKSVIQSLLDFNELNPVAPLQLLLEVSLKSLLLRSSSGRNKD